MRPCRSQLAQTPPSSCLCCLTAPPQTLSGPVTATTGPHLAPVLLHLGQPSVEAGPSLAHMGGWDLDHLAHMGGWDLDYLAHLGGWDLVHPAQQGSSSQVLASAVGQVQAPLVQVWELRHSLQ